MERPGVSHDWERLDAEISGEVVLPTAPAYDRASRALNARFDHVRPQAVVRCASPDDVAAALRFAKRRRIGVAPRGGGHCFAGRSSTGGMLVDVSAMSQARVEGGTVTMGGGTSLGEAYGSLLEHGLTVPAGSCPSVGVAGLALGGGLGIIGRKHGLTSDHLSAAEIVTADGRLVTCDEHHEPDLFWALRGAGAGNFGVVTSLTFRTIPAPDATNFHLTWPFSGAGAVIEAWQGWAPVAPEELSASLVIGAGGSIEDVPNVEVFGIMLGTESDTDGLLDDLVRAVPSGPTSVFREHLSFGDTVRYWSRRAIREGDPPGEKLRGARYIKSEFLDRPLAPGVIETLLEVFVDGRVEGQARELDFSPWGGAYNRARADASAFVHRTHRSWLKHAAEVAPDATAPEREAAHGWVTRSWNVVHPWGTGRVFPNFPDPDLEGWARAYYGTNLDRLQDVKARYDPENLFRFRQSLPLR